MLGFGGAHMLQILDHDNLEACHMNEGRAALLTLDLMDRYQYDLEKIKERSIFQHASNGRPICIGSRFPMET